MKYRKTALIEAEQFSPSASDLSPEFEAALCYRPDTGVAYENEKAASGVRPHIHTLEGTLIVSEGDWIARGINGEFWSIKPDIFASTYEPAEEQGKGALETFEVIANLHEQESRHRCTFGCDSPHAVNCNCQGRCDLATRELADWL